MSQIDRIYPDPAPSPGAPPPVPPPPAARRSWFGRHKLLTFVLFLLLVVPLFPAGVVVGQSGKADAIVNKAKKLAGMTVTPSAAPGTVPGIAAGEPTPGASPGGPAANQVSTPDSGSVAPAKVYSGTGDSIVKIVKPATGTVLFTLRHDTNSAIEVYSVESDTGIVLHYDTAYRGTVPLDTTSTETKTARIKTTGAWKFSLAAPAAAPAFDASVTGSGDEVLRYTGAGGTLNAANKGKSNFQVDARWNLDSTNLVNQIGNYTGQEIMPAGPKLVVVTSDGTWKLTVTP